MAETQQHQTTDAHPAATPAPVELRDIRSDHVFEALESGLRDFRAAPTYGLAIGAFFAAGGWFLLYLFNALEISYYVYPLATGFAMLAPFAAAGLYEVSRELESGRPLGWGSVFRATRSAGGYDLSWMVLVTTFAYIIWLDIAFALYVMFFGMQSLDFGTFIQALFTTPKGLAFLMIGNLVGAFLAVVVFSITAVSFPLLFDRNVDFVTAMITSVKVVRTNPRSMLMWALIIGGLLAVSILSVFVALIVVLPVLGHATWHLYRRAVRPVSDEGDAA